MAGVVYVYLSYSRTDVALLLAIMDLGGLARVRTQNPAAGSGNETVLNEESPSLDGVKIGAARQ